MYRLTFRIRKRDRKKPFAGSGMKRAVGRTGGKAATGLQIRKGGCIYGKFNRPSGHRRGF